jgi:NAD-dependent SIR2 family protein deacetylase
MDVAKIERVANWLSESDGLLINAGAGMGVDSGLPDFRGNDGFWRAYPALRNANLNFSDMADPSWFSKNPRLAWGFYGHRLELYRKTMPHYGFSILKRWSKSLSQGSMIFTSNVDGQFQVAGFEASSVYECHGSIHYLQCSIPCSEDVWSTDGFDPVVDENTSHLVSELPVCPICGSVARPNILMFSDDSWSSAHCDQQEVRLNAWLSKVNNPLVIEVGAGTSVPSVRVFSKDVCEKIGARLVRINIREADVIGTNSVGLELGALDGLRSIDKTLNSYD